MDDFTRQYLATALWASTDDDGEPLDATRDADDIAPESITHAEADCADFRAAFGAEIAGRETDAAHDLWLTRCGHGAGFWDGDWPEPAASRMTDYAHALGERWPYVGDDGRIYL